MGITAAGPALSASLSKIETARGPLVQIIYNAAGNVQYWQNAYEFVSSLADLDPGSGPTTWWGAAGATVGAIWEYGSDVYHDLKGSVPH